jgi:hypothetical protein
MNKNGTIENTVVICIFGTIVALIWFSFAYSNNAIAAKFVENVRNWQTLIGSIIASLAAVATVFVIRWQTKSEQRSRLIAERAFLRFSLENIGKYTQNLKDDFRPFVKCIDNEITNLINEAEVRGRPHSFSEVIDQSFLNWELGTEFPTSFISADLEKELRQIAETLSAAASIQPEATKAMSDMLHALQVQQARLTLLTQKPLTVKDFTSRFQELCEVMSRTDALYDFARERPHFDLADHSLVGRGGTVSVGPYVYFKRLVEEMDYHSMAIPAKRWDKGEH